MIDKIYSVNSHRAEIREVAVRETKTMFINSDNRQYKKSDLDTVIGAGMAHVQRGFSLSVEGARTVWLKCCQREIEACHYEIERINKEKAKAELVMGNIQTAPVVPQRVD